LHLQCRLRCRPRRHRNQRSECFARQRRFRHQLR
jgi:hypothetical protein